MSVIRGIDHVVIAVHELDAAAEQWRRLGFTLSPRGVHSASMGTANHTIMLQDDYFELLAVLQPTPRNQAWRRALARGDGLNGIALASASADEARAEFMSRGVQAAEVMDFERPVDRPGRRSVSARFRVTTLPEETVPGVGLFVCEQCTREAVWLPELMVHANGALGISEIQGVGNVQTAAEVWARVFGEGAVTRHGRKMTVRVGRHVIRLADGDCGDDAVRMTGITFRVAGLDEAREAITAGGLAHTGAGGPLTVAGVTGVDVAFRA